MEQEHVVPSRDIGAPLLFSCKKVLFGLLQNCASTLDSEGVLLIAEIVSSVYY